MMKHTCLWGILIRISLMALLLPVALKGMGGVSLAHAHIKLDAITQGQALMNAINTGSYDAANLLLETLEEAPVTPPERRTVIHYRNQEGLTLLMMLINEIEQKEFDLSHKALIQKIIKTQEDACENDTALLFDMAISVMQAAHYANQKMLPEVADFIREVRMRKPISR